MLRSFIIFFFYIFSILVFSQEKNDTTFFVGEYSVKIDSIIIRGNKTTEDFIISRELSFHDGDSLTPSKASYNSERVYSLGIFDHVVIRPVFIDNKTFAVVQVDEAWYIWPIPFLDVKNGDWNRLSYGVNLLVKNFRGMNETIRTNFSLGYDPSVSISYTKPVLQYGSNVSFSTALSYSNVQNESNIAKAAYGSQFNQKMLNAQIIIGDRFSLFHYIQVTGGFNYIETPLYIPNSNINASGQRIDHVVYLGVGYTYDSRDLAQFPQKGILGSVNILEKGLGYQNINYQVYTIDFREYRRIVWDLHGKWRFASRLTSGKLIPTYDLSFFGYGERVRGYSQYVEEGNNYYLTSLEFYNPLIKDININLDFIPIVPAQLLSYRVALYAEVFGDVGTVTQRGRNIGINDFESGYGFGFTLLILPYNILRLEMAFNNFAKSELLVDLGISF
jgi:outer membrane protein assembly factor BamA